MTRKLLIRDADHVRHVNDIACRQNFDVWAHGENMMLDAKSLLGLYALAGQTVHIVVEDSISDKTLDRLVAAMG